MLNTGAAVIDRADITTTVTVKVGPDFLAYFVCGTAVKIPCGHVCRTFSTCGLSLMPLYYHTTKQTVCPNPGFYFY